MIRRKKKYGRKPSLALSRLLAQDPSGETMRAIAMGFQSNLPRTLAAIPPGTPLDVVLDNFRRNTPIGEELPLFGFISLVAQFLAENEITVAIPGGTAHMDMYLVLLATSGELKTYTTNRLLDALCSQWKPRLLAEPGSSRGFLDAMVEHDGKAVFWMVDEFGKFWERTRDECGPHGETPRMLLRFYDGTAYEKRLHRDSVTVHEPYLSLLGTTVVESIHRQIRADDWVSGLAQRIGWVIVRETTDPSRNWRLRKHRYLPVSRDLLIHEWGKLLASPLLGREKEWHLSASGDRVYGDMWERLACSGLGHSFVRRLAFRALTYAACFHLICNKATPEIDAEDILWAERLTMFHLSDLKILLGADQAGELERMMMFGELLRQKHGPRFEPRHLKARFKDRLASPEDTRGLYLAITLKAKANGALNLPSEDRIEDLTGVRLSALDDAC